MGRNGAYPLTGDSSTYVACNIEAVSSFLRIDGDSDVKVRIAASATHSMPSGSSSSKIWAVKVGGGTV